MPVEGAGKAESTKNSGAWVSAEREVPRRCQGGRGGSRVVRKVSIHREVGLQLRIKEIERDGRIRICVSEEVGESTYREQRVPSGRRWPV